MRWRLRLELSIEVGAQNFFQPQPINAMVESNTISLGTRAYYMHSALKDWPDNLCHKVLDNVVSAMEPGYSKILLKENVIQETGAYRETTSLDSIMRQIGQVGA
ncbi:hypothetical protein P168DRAFT_316157 [Aspergillus campestris IBT 28561]|uniref:O-methyltransferase C-terminal domain-containing protein n=1 Tax=Aspergillus campestris (strain IBT 28561) TaxID=1392248 RepID=A0A2I1DCR0_ASPC2|nr:uncharacterized protein P168DRAFT_316157 [Aspergillus campestris IBT 28561]PKY07669.1 hypothetical protein P168DRAFT_316157 [Aspergillus campestris IBT 28561]